MIKINQSLRIILLVGLMALAALTACTYEEEDLFDQSAAQRLNASAKEYRDLLVSSQYGWAMEFWPNNGTMGGYVFTVKFAEDGSVEMCSEEDITYDGKTYEPGDAFTSNYSVKSEQGTILTFDSYNPLFHKFSEPQGSSNVSGYNSDYEFVFMRTSENRDTVYFRGKKYGQEMAMTRLGESAGKYMDESLTVLLASMSIDKLIINNIEYPVSVNSRHLSITDSENDTTYSCLLSHNNQEIIFRENIVLAGENLKSFMFDKQSSSFINSKGIKLRFLSNLEMLNSLHWDIDIRIDRAEMSDYMFNLFKDHFRQPFMIPSAPFYTFLSVSLQNLSQVYIWAENIDLEQCLFASDLFNFFVQGVCVNAYGIKIIEVSNNIYNFIITGNKEQKKHWSKYTDTDSSIYYYYERFLNAFEENSPYHISFDREVAATSAKFVSVDNPNVWFVFRRNFSPQSFSYTDFINYWNF